VNSVSSVTSGGQPPDLAKNPNRRLAGRLSKWVPYNRLLVPPLRMTILRPLPRQITRPLTFLVFCTWVPTMVILAQRSCVAGASNSLATDLARYGTSAEWRGVYYRNEKIGFTVSQTIATDTGFELQEDGRLQMSLLGARNVVSIRTRARVDRDFAVRTFEFSLDPGTGGTTVRGELAGRRLHLTVSTGSGTNEEDRDLADTPVLPLNLARRLADAGLVPGAHYAWTIFDPATLGSSPITIDVAGRELVSVSRRRLPAFRVGVTYAGLKTTSWITDTGEVVLERSPIGFETVRETPAEAQMMAVPFNVRNDLLSASAIVPTGRLQIDEPRDVRRLKLRLSGAEVDWTDVAGVGQSVEGDVVEIRDPRSLQPSAADPDVSRYLSPESLIESTAPEIISEAQNATRNLTGDRARAERLTRHVNAILEKKPTVSIPSAREVLRTRVGDCNEHTVLYVAMARAIGIPARIAVGLVSVHGAFYYHAWPEVYLADSRTRGLWLPVDPTLNEFPADATHLRLARGALAQQARILPLIGQLRIDVLDLETAPGSTPVVVGRRPGDVSPLSISMPTRAVGDCWSTPPERRRRR
jgi:transglutaminase-like putative cysteine protease